MIKVLVAALVGTIIGIIVMVAVIAISGTDTSGASSVGIGSLPLSTFSPSAGSTPSTGSSTPTSGGSTPSSSGGVTGDANAGKAVFASAGCSGCHTLAAAGATGQVGPNLDTALATDAGSTPLPQFVKDSIVNPDAVIAKGYTAGIMPTNFGSTLSASDIDNLVALIVQGK
jgi:cytochrome c551/c552